MKLFAVATITLALTPASAFSDELAEKGKLVFTQQAQPSCTICHTLADAGAAGAIGPNLDELRPTEEQVRNAVTTGVGVMPSFSETLSEEQIRAVARYVSSVTASQ
ncbi:c-type cytochrome [Marinobacter salinexigens]|nr:cytochrome c [Marinobacter salinexigens]